MEDRNVLRMCAVAFALLALSNLSKPLQLGDTHGFVFLGMRAVGTQNLLLGPLFGLYLGIYTWGIWHMRRFALPMGLVYAAYVIANLVLFNVRMPEEAGQSPTFSGVYASVAICISGGAAYYLWRNREDLL